MESPDFSRSTSTTAADLWVTVRREDGVLRADIRSGAGVPVLTRRIALDEGRDPAVRLLVLLISRAIEVAGEDSSLRASLAASAPSNPKTTVGLRLSVGVATGFWMQPLTPRIGPTFALHLDIAPVELGFRGSLLGWPCCDARVAGLAAGATELQLTTEGSLSLARFGSFELSALTAIGVSLTQMDVEPEAFSEPHPIQSFRRLAAIAEAGLDVELVRGEIALSVEGGALVRVGRARLGLPAVYAVNPLESGLLSPYLRLTAAISVD